MDMRFGTWNVKSLCGAGLLKTVASELAKYGLDLMAVQEVRWVEGGKLPADDCTFLHGNQNANHCFGTGLFIHKGIVLAVKRVEFVSDRMLYITIRGHWYDIIVTNLCASTEVELTT
jgi:exonuclease III